MLIVTTGTGVQAQQRAILQLDRLSVQSQVLCVSLWHCSSLVELRIMCFHPISRPVLLNWLHIYRVRTQDIKSSRSLSLQSFVTDPELPTNLKAYGRPKIIFDNQFVKVFGNRAITFSFVGGRVLVAEECLASLLPIEP